MNFRNTLEKFNLLNPNIEPTATGHIIEQIEMIEEIIEEWVCICKKWICLF